MASEPAHVESMHWRWNWSNIHYRAHLLIFNENHQFLRLKRKAAKRKPLITNGQMENENVLFFSSFVWEPNSIQCCAVLAIRSGVMSSSLYRRWWADIHSMLNWSSALNTNRLCTTHDTWTWTCPHSLPQQIPTQHYWNKSISQNNLTHEVTG